MTWSWVGWCPYDIPWSLSTTTFTYLRTQNRCRYYAVVVSTCPCWCRSVCSPSESEKNPAEKCFYCNGNGHWMRQKSVQTFPNHLFIDHIFKTFEGIRSIWYLSIPPYKISTESIISIIATVSHLSQLLIHFFRKRPEILGSFFQHWVINLKWEIHMISLSAALDWPRLCLCLALFYVLAASPQEYQYMGWKLSDFLDLPFNDAMLIDK